MSKKADQDNFSSWQRPTLQLDRENKKVLGVCGGLARYLEVPPALVRVIYVIACLVSPFLILVYLILYWLMEDEKRPGRLKAALSAYMPGSPTDFQKSETVQSETPRAEPQEQVQEETRMYTESARGFDLKKPLYRSRHNVRVAGVCAGIADYLNVNTFIVRAVTLVSLFVLGGVTFWAYVICWIVLDKEPKSLQKSHRGSSKAAQSEQADGLDSVGQHKADTFSIQQCAERLYATEQRLRNAEAYITSRQFRLHCEINRIQ